MTFFSSPLGEVGRGLGSRIWTFVYVPVLSRCSPVNMERELFEPPAAWSDPSIWAGLIVCPEGEAELWAYRQRRQPGTFLRILRGRRCATLDRCLAEIAAAMQLPYCMEPTWASLRENWPDGDFPAVDRGILMITVAHRLLQRHPDDFASLAAMLADLAAGKLVCHTGPAHWRIVLHCETRFRALVQNRLDVAGVTWGRVAE